MSGEQRATRTFRASRPRYDPQRADRQSRATRLAIEQLGVTEAMDFLNAQHATLGARPIDLAGDSDASLVIVEQSLRAARATPASE